MSMEIGQSAGQAEQAGLEIRLLGELSLLKGGARVELPPSKKTRALLAYLVATGRPQSRDHLCALLWDGPDDPRAQLRWSLTKVRPLVDTGKDAAKGATKEGAKSAAKIASEVVRLRADRERVSFDSAGVLIDLEVVRALSRRGLGEATLAELTRAAGCFTGTFLEGLDLSGCHRYHAWCVALREEMHALRVAVLATLIDRLRATPEEALRHARALLGLDPLAESSHISVVRLLGELGRTREALEQYERCRQLLDRELGGRPSRELEETRMALTRSSSGSPVGTVGTVLPGALAEKGAASADGLGSVPFVGRQAERATLERKLAEAVAGRGVGVVLILGDPGMGKSRLLEELVIATHAIAGQVLRGRAFEAEMVRPYGVWIDALRSAGTRAGLEDARDLAPLLPELGQSGADRTASDRNRLFEAVVDFLRARARDKAPLLLILDDLQWLDEASTALLHFVARALEAHPVLIACAARGGEMGDNPAVLRLVRALERDRRLHQMVLSPLDAAATAALAAAVSPGVDTARVFQGSEGNPLFAIEIARAQAMGPSGAWGASGLSHTLTALISDRLERLDEPARQVLPFAAALGRSFDPQILTSVVNMPVTDLLGALDDLERRGVFRATATDNYDFSHDLVRQTAYQQLSEPRRRLVHLQLARAFAAMPDPGGALASDLAHHAGLGGDDETAARAYLAAGQRSLRLFAWVEATELSRRGSAHLPRLPRATRLHLQIELLGVEVMAKPSGDRARDVDVEILRTLSEAEQAGLHADAARGYYLRSVMQFRDGNTVGAGQASMRGAVAAGRSADAVTAARSKAEAGRCLMILERDVAEAKSFLEEASGVLVEEEDTLVVDWGLGLLHRYTGDAQSAAQGLERAAMLSSRLQSHWEESECLRTLTLLALERGDFAEARARCPSMLDVAFKMGEGSERPIALALDSLARVLDGDASAENPFDRALDDVRAADAKAMLSTLLNFAAAHDLACGQSDRARQRAEEALRAASAVERRNQIAIAQSILARLAIAAGDRDAAREHLAPARSDLDLPLVLSVQARRAVEQALGQLGIMPDGASSGGVPSGGVASGGVASGGVASGDLSSGDPSGGSVSDGDSPSRSKIRRHSPPRHA